MSPGSGKSEIDSWLVRMEGAGTPVERSRGRPRTAIGT